MMDFLKKYMKLKENGIEKRFQDDFGVVLMCV